MSSSSSKGLTDVPTDTEQEQEEREKKLRSERMERLKMNSRIGTPFAVRLMMASSISFLAGMGLGIRHGSQMAGFRFRAENAHRFPTSTTGWYLYHKSKNYHMAFGGVREGLKMGAKVSFWTTSFFAIEDLFDRYRGSKDFVNTVIASLSVAGTFSLWNRFPITVAARTAKMGLVFGVSYGLAQDALATFKGRSPGYMDFILRKGSQPTSKELPSGSI
ncbi:hypothetical protein HYALB_00011531 [Hymenoscyphus albidus]|uniref:Uncharacterized protein n=1 Tax=Hymenoscyphus albidus TaxID=595503 RepID=A0A9N9PYN5_9HELO|nr:hypothetical protein HYALB_00011531 [Hymenoscyphus albidus]